jgi:hypothetical protein
MFATIERMFVVVNSMWVENSSGGQYPGVYMFSQSARMYRPVKYLALDKLDYVGPFEQPFMVMFATIERMFVGVNSMWVERPGIRSDSTQAISMKGCSNGPT